MRMWSLGVQRRTGVVRRTLAAQGKMRGPASISIVGTCALDTSNTQRKIILHLRVEK